MVETCVETVFWQVTPRAGALNALCIVLEHPLPCSSSAMCTRAMAIRMVRYVHTLLVVLEQPYYIMSDQLPSRARGLETMGRSKLRAGQRRVRGHSFTWRCYSGGVRQQMRYKHVECTTCSALRAE